MARGSPGRAAFAGSRSIVRPCYGGAVNAGQPTIVLAGAGPAGMMLADWRVSSGVPVRVLETFAMPGPPVVDAKYAVHCGEVA